MTNSKKIISLSAVVLAIAATSISAFASNSIPATATTPAMMDKSISVATSNLNHDSNSIAATATTPATKVEPNNITPNNGVTLTSAGKVISKTVNSTTDVRSNCFDLMVNTNGEFVDSTTFENNLDDAIKSGKINADKKDYYMSLYTSCIANGGGCCTGKTNKR
ncbi:MAG: hypothetical protein RSB96_03235 [Oscillospiraceae bacterium]